LRIDDDYATQFTLTTGIDAGPQVLDGYLQSIANSIRTQPTQEKENQ
jgi:hypothetical protein